MVENFKNITSKEEPTQKQENVEQLSLEEVEQRARKLFESGGLELVVKNVPSFVAKGVKPDTVFQSIAKTIKIRKDGSRKRRGKTERPPRKRHRAQAYRGYSSGLIECLKNLEGLTASLAKDLILQGFGAETAKYFHHFEKMDENEIIDLMINTKQEKALIRYIENFGEVSHADIIKKLLAAGYNALDIITASQKIQHNN